MTDQERIAELESQLAASQARECRMRAAVNKAMPMISHFVDSVSVEIAKEVRAALSASGPCPHAAEVERLRKLCGEAAVRW